MGSIFSKIYRRKDRKILFLGLPNSYKTTTFNALQRLYLKIQQKNPSSPTIGFNTANIYINNKNFIIWDLGGDKSIRSYWKCYFTNTKAIVYFFDAENEIETGMTELVAIKDDVELKGCVFMVIMAGMQVDVKDERILKIKNVLEGKRAGIFMYKIGNDKDVKDAFMWLANQV